MPRRNERSEERSPLGPKSQKAPMWLISEAINFLRSHHPAVVRMIYSRMMKEQGEEDIQRFLIKNHNGLGTRVRNLLREMKYKWDAAELDDSYIEVVERAMNEEGLLCQ